MSLLHRRRLRRRNFSPRGASTGVLAAFSAAVWSGVLFMRTSGLLCHCTVGPCIAEDDTCATDGKCFASLEKMTNGSLLRSYGCFEQQGLFPRQNPVWCHEEEHSDNALVISCCNNGSLCNQNLTLVFDADEINSSAPMPDPAHINSLWLVLLVVIPPTVIFILVAAIFVCYHHRRQVLALSTGPFPGEQKLLQLETGMSPLREVMESSSGSGPGVGILIQRTIARQICLEVVVGKGRFGEVWRASWNGEHVAVKIFPSRDERSWFREVEIYQTVMLRHENILGFIAADNKDTGMWTQLWLVTEYHPQGSLFDFLSQNTVDVLTMVKMTLSIASGLVHLHIDIDGAMGKPGIAHQDIKSKNILVKSNRTCCIADLGLAVKHKQDENSVEKAENSRTGTRRYMAPEILDDSFDSKQFESFKRADIYALGLVFWEIVRRTAIKGRCEEYQLPYYDVVPPDPTHEEMRKVVALEKRRPNIANKWQSIEALRTVSHVMKECWHHSPPARLSSLRVKKTLLKLSQSENFETQ